MKFNARIGKRGSAFLMVSLALCLFLWAAPVHAASANQTVPENSDAPPAKLQAQTPTAEADSRQEGEGEDEQRYVTIDFDNVDIRLLIKYISEMTGTNFVIDKAVKGNVTIISPTKITVDEAYQVFESVLEVQGYTTVRAGSITKVVPSIQARSKNVETGLRTLNEENTDKVVTQLIPLQHADPEDLRKIFAPLVSKTSVVISYLPTGTLIVTDVLSNINRLIKIIKEIDVPETGEEITVLPLLYAKAADVAKSVDTFLSKSRSNAPAKGKTTPTGTLKILPDERTNLLIVLASVAETEKIKMLVDLLDKEIPRGDGDIHVYYLQNANAENLAAVLTSLPAKKEGDGAQKGKAPTISKNVQIVADKSTNSLVITAEKDDYAALEDVIKKLDIPRRMVYLEVLIMEVSVDKVFNLGAEWRGVLGYNGDQNAAFGGSRGSDASMIPAIPTAESLLSLPKGIAVGVLGRNINIAGINYPSIGAVFEAFKQDSDVHIVSNPQLLTTDNEEAEIKVGENVPYITSQNTNVTSQDYTNYEYRDVGVTLKITPQINQEGIVRLKIFSEVVKLKDPTKASVTPTTLKRTADTTVIVQDLNTLVIGGIIGDDIKDVTYKMPLLGDIPVLGWLFKNKSTTKARTNLYIFITPKIINTPGDAETISNEKKTTADEFKSSGEAK